MYCVNCGKEKDIFRDGLCVECYVKDNIFTEGPDIINITKCAHCDAYQYKNNWTNEDFKDVFKREILNKFNSLKILKGRIWSKYFLAFS